MADIKGIQLPVEDPIKAGIVVPVGTVGEKEAPVTPKEEPKDGNQ